MAAPRAAALRVRDVDAVLALAARALPPCSGSAAPAPPPDAAAAAELLAAVARVAELRAAWESQGRSLDAGGGADEDVDALIARRDQLRQVPVAGLCVLSIRTMLTASVVLLQTQQQLADGLAKSLDTCRHIAAVLDTLAEA
nr:hypothetical protein HK105_004613 [Polyrhizophydium stewartii]